MGMQPDKGAVSYLDLIITTLSEHEKTLDELLEKLVRITNNLQEVTGTFSKPDKTKPALTDLGVLAVLELLKSFDFELKIRNKKAKKPKRRT